VLLTIKLGKNYLGLATPVLCIEPRYFFEKRDPSRTFQKLNCSVVRGPAIVFSENCQQFLNITVVVGRKWTRQDVKT